MCGIAGFVDFASARSPSANRALADAMGDAMKHRGPDGAATWSGPDRRLAVVPAARDPRPHQGRRSADAHARRSRRPDLQWRSLQRQRTCGRSWRRPATVSAAIPMRRRCFTAATIWGVAKTVQRLIGMFAFAYWDGRRGTLTLARDRLGKKPVYWFQTQRSFAFASELRPLLLHDDCPREIDRNSVADLLRFHYVPAPHSIFQGVRKLEPGTLLTLDVTRRSVETEAYWRLSEEVARSLSNPFAGSDEEAVAETERLLLDVDAAPPDLRRAARRLPLGRRRFVVRRR